LGDFELKCYFYQKLIETAFYAIFIEKGRLQPLAWDRGHEHSA